MVTVKPIVSAEYYLNKVALEKHDYYIGNGEGPGRWTGEYAQQLGLSGEVIAEQFKALCEAIPKHPETGESLKWRPNTKVQGWDGGVSELPRPSKTAVLIQGSSGIHPGWANETVGEHAIELGFRPSIGAPGQGDGQPGAHQAGDHGRGDEPWDEVVRGEDELCFHEGSLRGV